MFKLPELDLSAILLVGLLAVIGYQFHSIVSERDQALLDLAAERHALAVAKAEYNVKQVALKEQAQKDTAAQQAQHISDIQFIVNAYLKGFNHEKALDQKIIAGLRSDSTNRVRELQSRNDSLARAENEIRRLAENNSDTAAIGQGEESADFYRKAFYGSQEYIGTLETAGAICAADYNKCYAYVKGEQARLGVENFTQNVGDRSN